MQKDCCSNTGLGKWFCPSVTGVVAGLIMIAAGSMKFIAGKGMLTGVGGMVLGLVGVQNPQIALVLGTIAASIEVLGGLSFAVGCRKTSRYAAFLLSFVMGIALLYRLNNLKHIEANLYVKAAGLLEQIRLDLLLFAVFFQKALKLIKNWCGMGCCDTACCTTEAKKK